MASFTFLGTINFIFFLIFNLTLSPKLPYGIINKTYSLDLSFVLVLDDLYVYIDKDRER